MPDPTNTLEQIVNGADSCVAACTAISEIDVLRFLVDSMTESIVAKDTASRYLLANRAAAERLGTARPRMLVGKTDFDFYPNEKAAQFLAAEQEIVRTGLMIRGEEEAVPDPVSGESHWQQTTKMPLLDNDGKVVGIVAITRDVEAHV